MQKTKKNSLTFQRLIPLFLVLFLSLFHSSCRTNLYIIGGTITGLNGTLVLQNNGTYNLTLSTNGNFAFSIQLPRNSSYQVTVLTQPNSQICTVVNGSGTVLDDVTNIEVTCVNTYTVGGTISGLVQNGLVLLNNGSDNLTVTAHSTSFQFATTLFNGDSYNVTIDSLPLRQLCTLTNSSGTINGANITNVNINCSSIPLAYISSDNTNELDYCSVGLEGLLGNCTTTPPGTQTWGPFAVSFATVSETLYAYVANNGDCNIDLCGVDIATGALTTCQIAESEIPAPGWCPTGIILTTVGSTQYAYVSDNVSHDLFQCHLGSNGLFTSCATTPSVNPGWSPFSTAFAIVNGTQYAYAASNFDGVFQCVVNQSDGTFSSCQLTPSSSAPSWTTNGLAFATVNNIQYAYVADNAGSVYQCTLASNGNLVTCSPTPSLSAFGSPRAIAFGTVNGIQYAYIADITDNAIYLCTLNTDGSFNICSITPSSDAPSWRPRGVTISNIEN